MNVLAESLAGSPALIPHSLDLDRLTITLLRLSRADYEAASFLDARIEDPARLIQQLTWAELASAVDQTDLSESCHFIFHIGHVGSTLLSRLLGKHPAILSLREPQILRTLAQATRQQRDAHLPAILKLLSRTFEPGARALVKTTSFVSEISAELLARSYAPRALVMGVAPETYLASIFGGANSPLEARMLARSRLTRLAARMGAAWTLAELGEGEVVALGWACEASALADAEQRATLRVQALDFDDFLADPQIALARVFAHFSIDVDACEIARVLSGPEMRTYSKAPQYAYDRELRRSVLDQGRRNHAREINRGLSWLDRAANELPQLRTALALFEK
ncbi:MAG TPA: hypothetical protein VGI20_08565 [Rhizomicrobium sp.]